MGYFRGWYFRCQGDSGTLALIVAYHTAHGKKTCSLQLITEDGAWNTSFSHEALTQTKDGVEIAGNKLGKEGIFMNLNTAKLRISGTLTFGALTPIRYDIMGPFRYVPFLECRHSIYSMDHRVDGVLEINGRHYRFTNGRGYMEGDRGRSFPAAYLWTQCFLPEGSVMLSVADIPFLGMHFTGIIGVIRYRGKEYRVATYLGASAERICNGEVEVRQGRYRLIIRKRGEKGHALAAPVGGCMRRTIRENVCCSVYFRFCKEGHALFGMEADNAAMEYEYPL